MKTLQHITIIAILFTMLSNQAIASSLHTFKIFLPEGTVEVTSKQETLKQEIIPQTEIQKSFSGYHFDLIPMPQYHEPLLDEDIPSVETTHVKYSSYHNHFDNLLQQIQKPEKLVEENEIDTTAIFAQIQNENRYTLSIKDLLQIYRPEKELSEEKPVLEQFRLQTAK